MQNKTQKRLQRAKKLYDLIPAQQLSETTSVTGDPTNTTSVTVGTTHIFSK